MNKKTVYLYICFEAMNYLFPTWSLFLKCSFYLLCLFTPFHSGGFWLLFLNCLFFLTSYKCIYRYTLHSIVGFFFLYFLYCCFDGAIFLCIVTVFLKCAFDVSEWWWLTACCLYLMTCEFDVIYTVHWTLMKAL